MNHENNEANKAKRPNKDTDNVAFVLSGGGNRGAMEVGVILALLEHGIKPQILVGTSVGAINATAMAINPTLEGARWLESKWRQVTRKDVLPDNYLTMALRLLTGGGSLFSNKKLKSYLESQLPEGIRTFGDVKTARLYITAVDLNTRELHVFGIDRNESIVDAIMASTAYPLLLSPWEYQGRLFVDGALVSDLPIRVAVQMKASEIYAIDVAKRATIKPRRRGVISVLRQVLNTAAYQRFLDDMGWASKLSQDAIHYIGVNGFEDVGLRDFTHTAAMIETGYQAGMEYLSRSSSRDTVDDKK
jgi:NTE family protein